MKNIIILLGLLLVSCSVIKTELTNDDISATWTVVSNESIKMPSFENFSKDGRGSFYSLFGAVVWSESNGKLFELTYENKVVTNLYDHPLMDSLDFRYELINDSIVNFICNFPTDSTQNIMPVKYNLNGGQMTWIIDGFFKIKLSKE